MNWHERAMRRAMFLAGAPDEQADEWRKGRHMLAAWIRDRCAAMTEEEMPRGKRPTLANIRDILREPQLGGIALGHLCAVFQTTPGYWWLESEADVLAAAKLRKQRMVLVEHDDVGPLAA